MAITDVPPWMPDDYVQTAPKILRESWSINLPKTTFLYQL